MFRPFGVEGFAGIPHFVQVLIRFFGLVQPGVKYRDSEHHEQLVLQVIPELLLRNRIQMAGFKALLGHNELMLIPPGHHIPLHGLVCPADPIAVQVNVYATNLYQEDISTLIWIRYVRLRMI